MALIVYPDAGFNSYVSEVEADDIALGYLTHPNWEVLSVEEKERYLRTAFRTIQNLEGFEGPVSPNLAECLPTAQVEIAMNDVFHGLSLNQETSQLVKKEKAGPVELEYFDGGQAAFQASPVPPDSVKCLKSYGWKGYNASSGLSTIRHHR